MAAANRGQNGDRPGRDRPAGPVPVLLMVLLLFATQACTDIFLPGLPQIAAEFHSSIDVASLTISVYNIVQAMVVLVIGVVSDVRGRRPTMLICLALHVAATAWIAMAGSIATMIMLRAVQALGSAAVYIVLRMIIKDTLDKQAQIHATGLLVIGLVLSPILAPVVGGWIVHWSGWRNCFWALVIVDLPLLCWAWLAVRETNLRQHELRAAFRWRAHAGHYVAVLRTRSFLGMALIVGAGFAAFYAFISISSFLFIRQFRLSENIYGNVFIALALAYLAGNRLMSNLNSRGWSPQKIIQLGLWGSTLGALVIAGGAMATGQALLAALAIVAGTCLLRWSTALIIPPAQVEVSSQHPQHSAHALGLLTCIQYCFAAVGTMVVSTMPLAPSLSFLVSSVLFVLLSWLGYRVIR